MKILKSLSFEWLFQYFSNSNSSLGTIACHLGLVIIEPSMIDKPIDPFTTPLEILSKLYCIFFPHILNPPHVNQ